MNTKRSQDLHVHYDNMGDMLEVRIGRPTPAHMVDLGDDIFQRVDDKTGIVTGLTIFNFKKRMEKEKRLDISAHGKIPINA